MAGTRRSRGILRGLYAALAIVPFLFCALFQVRADGDFLLSSFDPSCAIVALMALVCVVCGYPLSRIGSGADIKGVLGFSLIVASVSLLFCTPLLYHCRVDPASFLALGAITCFTGLVGSVPMRGDVSTIAILILAVICVLPRVWVDVVLLNHGAKDEEGGGAANSIYRDPGCVLWVHIYGSFFALISRIVMHKIRSKKHGERKEEQASDMDYYATGSSLFGLLMLWSLYPSLSTYQSGAIASSDGTKGLLFNLSTHILYISQCAAVMVAFPLGMLLEGGKIDTTRVGVSVMAGAYAAAPLALPLTGEAEGSVVGDVLPHTATPVVCSIVVTTAALLLMRFGEGKVERALGFPLSSSPLAAHTLPGLVGFLFRVIYLAAKGHRDEAGGYASVFGVSIGLAGLLGALGGALVGVVDKQGGEGKKESPLV